MPNTHLPVHVPLVKEPWGVFRSLNEARRNVLSIIPEIATTQPIVSGKTGKRWHMLMDPDALRHVLLERVDEYPKSDVTKNLLENAIGDSLFIAEGPHWRWQRRAAAPVFSHRNVTALAPIMSAAAIRSAARISAAGARAVDVAADMVDTTFDVISEVTFSDEGTMDAASVHGAIDAYIAEAGRISLFDILKCNCLFAGSVQHGLTHCQHIPGAIKHNCCLMIDQPQNTPTNESVNTI